MYVKDLLQSNDTRVKTYDFIDQNDTLIKFLFTLS